MGADDALPAPPPGVRQWDLRDAAGRAAFEAFQRTLPPSPPLHPKPGDDPDPHRDHPLRHVWTYEDGARRFRAWAWDLRDPEQEAHFRGFQDALKAEHAREGAPDPGYERAVREAREGCVPGPDPQGLTRAEFELLLPEKLEYYGGRDGRPSVPGGPQFGRDLLRALLKNLGLREAVRLAPRERWEAALQAVYGERGRRS